MNSPLDKALPTEGFNGITARVEKISAFGLVLLHAVDYHEPAVHALSRDLCSGGWLPKDFVAEGLFAVAIWITLSIACSCVDSFRLFLRLGGAVLPKSLAAFARSKRTGVFALGIAFQFWQITYLNTLLSGIHPYGPNFGMLSLAMLLMLITRPPIVLILASSSPESIELLQRIKKMMRRLRHIALLDTQRTSIPHSVLSPADNLRTFEGLDWASTVRKLMDSVPLIVLDGRARSESVAEELRWVTESPDRVQKCVVVVPTDGWDQSTEATALFAARAGVRTSTLEELSFVVWGRAR